MTIPIEKEEVLSKIEFRINKRPSSFKMTDKFKGFSWNKNMEHDKLSVRCKVEHVFLIVKNEMGDVKVIYSTFPADISKQSLYKCGLRIHPFGHFTFDTGCDIC